MIYNENTLIADRKLLHITDKNKTKNICIFYKNLNFSKRTICKMIDKTIFMVYYILYEIGLDTPLYNAYHVGAVFCGEQTYDKTNKNTNNL